MIISTGELHGRERPYQGQDPAAILELEPERLVRPGEPVRYRLTARRLEAELLVRGSLATAVECRCTRCAEWFRQPLQVDDFLRSYPLSAENEAIDLTPAMREDILLALPMNPVCAPGCRGVCPRCGANLNQAACRCGPEADPQPWSALDRLRLVP